MQFFWIILPNSQTTNWKKKTPAPNPHGHNLFCWIFKIIKKQNLIIFQDSKTILFTLKFNQKMQNWSTVIKACQISLQLQKDCKCFLCHCNDPSGTLHNYLERISNLKLTGKHTLLVKGLHRGEQITQFSYLFSSLLLLVLLCGSPLLSL